MENNKYPTVSDINLYLKKIIAEDENLKKIAVVGEISNFTDHARLGHLYFSLKDDKCAIKAVMFKWNKQRLNFAPESGMKVVVYGSVSVYERDGTFQIVVEHMIPYGVGALQLAFEKLKQKLEAEGLFAPEHKKKIPAIPRRIGVITAKKSAALQDILNILSRRYPLATVIVIDSLVQGTLAPDSLIKALKDCEGLNLDTLIIARGGGSMEDLWAFNDERLARAIYDCPVPVISAVGHETDFTICDFVADLRAPTPSAAAELVAPNISELYKYIDNKQKLLYNNISSRIKGLYMKYEGLAGVIQAREPRQLIQSKLEYVNGLSIRMSESLKRGMLMRENIFSSLVSKLDVLSPLKTMARGFSVTLYNGSELSSVSEVWEGNLITTKLSDGELESKITKILRKDKL